MVLSYSHMQRKTDRSDATFCQTCHMSSSRETFPVPAMPKPVILTVLLLQPALLKLPSHQSLSHSKQYNYSIFKPLEGM